MRGVIRLGDSTSHGGKVVTGQEKSLVMERAVACVGDRCTCPMPGHHDCVIVEGDPAVQIDGKAVAFDGHKTSCGAALISRSRTVSQTTFQTIADALHALPAPLLPYRRPALAAGKNAHR